MRQDERSTTLLDEVARDVPDGERLRTCLQCGTCGGSCPNGPDMDYSPRALFALMAADRRREVLSANTMWVCVSCYFCTTRCPKQIPITDIMYALKRKAIAEGFADDNDAAALARNFRHYIDKYGRSFEFGLATRYYLSRKPAAFFGLGPLGLTMMRHGRMHLSPSKIRGTAELRAIIKKAEEIGGAS